MKFPQKWMDHWYLRTFAGILGFRNPFDMHGLEPFTPYFQYRIGSYQPDHYLYFKEPPTRSIYMAEIFNKMYEYEGHGLTEYIEFHYDAFEDKEEFVRFLRDEAARALEGLRRYRYMFWARFTRIKARLRATQKWVEEEWERLREDRRVEKNLREAPAPPAAMELQEETAPEIEALVGKIEERISTMMDAHSGKAGLYNQHHMTRLIQLLIVMQGLRAPGRKVVALFKAFSDTDMAAILRQFELFADKKTNTLQVQIGKVRRELDFSDPAIEKLVKALTDFFFR